MFSGIKKWGSRPLQRLWEGRRAAVAWIDGHNGALWLGGAAVFRLCLDLMYVYAASPSYAYAGLVLAPDFLKCLLSLLLYVVLFALLPKRENDAVCFLLHLQFLLTVAPILSFYAWADQSTPYVMMVALCVAVQALLLRGSEKKERACYIVGVKNYVSVALGITVLAAAAIPLLYNGFEGLKAFDFTYIYQMRQSNTFPAGFGYLFGWVMRTVLPFGVLWTLDKGRYATSGVMILAELLFFMLSGEKFTLFILFPVIGIYLLSKTGYLIKLSYALLSLLLCGVILAYRALGRYGALAAQLLAVRTFFHPADNKFRFYGFFSRFPRIRFSDGLLGKLLGLCYPYAASSGQVVYADTGGELGAVNVNTGYLGEAYAQLGFPGMLLMSVLLALVLRALRHYDTSKERFSLIAGLFSVYIIILNDGALLTTLFSGGMMIAILLLMIYFEKSKEGDVYGIQRQGSA